MHIKFPRRAIVSAGACALLLGFAVPSAAMTPAVGVAKSAPASAIPSPHDPHSGKMVPGVTGAAARRADPPVSAATRWAQLNAASQRAGRQGVTSAALKPDLSSWSGAFHGYWGTFPAQTVYGAQATQGLNSSTELSSSDPDTIYSPTLDPSGITCIEMSTIYISGTDEIGAWDWCASSPGFDKTTPVNSSFLATYTTTIGGQPFYSVQDVQTDPTTNSWTSYLYNYSTGAWDTYYTSANTSKLSNSGGGWDMSEVYTYYNSSTGEGHYCTETYGANLETTGLQYQLSSGGAWTAASTSNSSMNLAYPRGSDLGCANSTYWLPTANSEWRVTNGTHGAAELIGTGSGKCVDTNGQVFANGTEEQIYTCHSGPGQEWTWNSLGQLTVDGGKYCLDAKGQGKSPGTVVDLWQCNGGTNQEWTFSIKHTIVGIQSGLCLGVTGGGTGNGTPLELQTCNDATSQQWTWS
jgi:Ricin-type beta-trefoil lectin domain